MWAWGMRNCVSRLAASTPSRDLADMAGEVAVGTRGEERNDGNDAGVDPEGLVKASLSFRPCSSSSLGHPKCQQGPTYHILT